MTKFVPIIVLWYNEREFYQKSHLITCFRRFTNAPNHLAAYLPMLGFSARYININVNIKIHINKDKLLSLGLSGSCLNPARCSHRKWKITSKAKNG